MTLDLDMYQSAYALLNDQGRHTANKHTVLSAGCDLDGRRRSGQLTRLSFVSRPSRKIRHVQIA